MIVEFQPQSSLDKFDKETLAILQPYFDINLITATADQRHQWFFNLLDLAQQNLSIAHCIQHNQAPRTIMQLCFSPDNWPNNLPVNFDATIGCYSSTKVADDLSLNNHKLNGTKHWVTSLEHADYGIFRVPDGDADAFILVDFRSMPHTKPMSWMTPIGMELAKPGSFTVTDLPVPPEFILGHKTFYENHKLWSPIIGMHDYAFITNYLGLIISLHREFGEYLDSLNRTRDFEFNRLGMAISGLEMLWKDNLLSVDVLETDDKFWHRRNTQYTMSKDIVCQLITMILQQGDSRWLDAKSATSQRMRDALTFCSHMKPLAINLTERNFFKI